MAIRRCPYCKAIIDESQKYCNNCGTQLLFPQDDAIQEDIKGEKIRDDDFRDAELDEEEAGAPPDSSGPKDTRKEFDLGKILDGKASFPDAAPDDREDEIPPVSDEPIIKSAAKPRGGPKPRALSKSKPEPESADIPPPAIKKDEPVPPAGPADELQEKGRNERVEGLEETVVEEALGDDADLSDTDDLADADDIISDETMGEEIFADEEIDVKEELEDELLDEDRPDSEDEKAVETFDEAAEPEGAPAIAAIPSDSLNGDLDEEDKEIAANEDRGETPDAAAVDEDRDEAETREEIGRLIAALEKKHKKPAASRAAKKADSPKKVTSGLPAWAEPSPTAELPAPDEKEAEAEEIPGGSFAPGDTMDFEEEVMRDADRTSTRATIGIPETLSKIELPGGFKEGQDEFGRAVAGSEDWDRAGSGAFPSEDEAEPGSDRDFVPRRRLGFFGMIKAGICDIFFVVLLWFVAVWLAAKILNLPIKTLIVESAVPLGLFFGILLIGYLFLFLFFLGETIGGRIAAAKR